MNATSVVIALIGPAGPVGPVGPVGLAVLVACSAARAVEDSGRGRTAARRRRFLEHRPTQVDSLDIRTQLVRDGVSPAQARLITDKAAEHGIKPFTMWLWIQQFDAQSLRIVVGADLSHRELLTHLSNGTAPDLEELEVLAAANGLHLVASTMRSPRRRVLVDSGATSQRRLPLPPIHDPGTGPSSWPGFPGAKPLPGPGAGGVAA